MLTHIACASRRGRPSVAGRSRREREREDEVEGWRPANLPTTRAGVGVSEPQRGRPGGAAFVALTVETRTTSLLPEPGLLNDVEIRLSRLEYGEYLVGVEDVRFDELTPLELGA